METSGHLDRARKAFAARAWPDAFDAFSSAELTASSDPTDLEALATAAYLTGHDGECTDAWTLAHQVWHERDDQQRAARCAFWLGFALVQRGDMAQGGGWLARAGRIVQDHELDTVERGYLLVPEGLMAMGSGQLDTALDRFAQADALARRFDDRDLSVMGTLGQGQTLLRMGRRTEGLGLFDEAMVAVTAGETSPMISGLVYCAVIDSCQQVFDLRRAREWTAALDRWCGQQPGLVPYRGQCLVHRSQVLQLQGNWGDADAVVEQALLWLSDPPHPALGMAHYQRGELHRLRGHAELAEAAYRDAHATGRDPQPGLALLRLAEGETGEAAAAIEAAIESADDKVSRVRLLPAFAEIMLADGRPDDARRAADELTELATDEDATVLGALAGQTVGALLLADGDARAALDPLRDALRAWQELNAPYEVARVRMLVAAACRQLDDRGRADMECDVARDAFEGLGAGPALAELDRMEADEAPEDGPDSALTDRQLEVLRLVAAGMTNQEIAGELAISVKTVERHLGNIFTALGVTNRTAATAQAFEQGVL